MTNINNALAPVGTSPALYQNYAAPTALRQPTYGVPAGNAAVPTGYSPVPVGGGPVAPTAAPTAGAQAPTTATGGGFLSDVASGVSSAIGNVFQTLTKNADSKANDFAANGVDPKTGVVNQAKARDSKIADDNVTMWSEWMKEHDDAQKQIIQNLLS